MDVNLSPALLPNSRLRQTPLKWEPSVLSVRRGAKRSLQFDSLLSTTSYSDSVCCALAFSLLDNGFFYRFLQCTVTISPHLSMCSYTHLFSSCPSYSVPDRSSFIGYNLVKEAENALVQLKALLEVFIHLTLSFDGWSSRRNDEIYTVHVTTPTRMSYMVAGIILTGISTTSETIFENLKQVNSPTALQPNIYSWNSRFSFSMRLFDFPWSARTLRVT
jgi:hypothetical protein